MAGYFRYGGKGRNRLRLLAVRAFEQAKFRKPFNSFYNQLGWGMQERIYRTFAKIFRAGGSSHFEDGAWHLKFVGRDMVVPLRKDQAWLDWDCALTVLGHDQEVKKTYDALINSTLRPDTFLDIGANYGTHSVMMLVAGVPTVAVEPNPVCVEGLKALADANHVRPIIVDCALADYEGEITLDFPERDTWLGTIRLDSGQDAAPGMTSRTVPLRTLDAIAAQIPQGRLLIKLDAEGSEPAILRGGKQFLAERRPLIIFECWSDAASRQTLQATIPDFYSICRLPWSPSQPGQVIEPANFPTAEGTNYIAVPTDLLANAGRA